MLEIKKVRIIICEGEHDKNFLETLIERRGLPEFQVIDAHACCGIGGVSGLAPALEGLYAIDGFTDLTGIAIVTDNDNKKSLPELQRNLEALQEYDSIQSLKIGRMAGIKVVIIPIPDYDNHGSLETLCLPSLHDKWPPARKCIDDYLRCTGAFRWQRHKLEKAQVRCIISGFYNREPDKGLGYLFKADKALADHPCFNSLSDILTHFDAIID